MLDLNQKFDYFICMILHGQRMPLEDVSGPLIHQLIKNKQEDREKVLELFTEFTTNAKMANLGERQALKAEVKH